MVTAVLLVAAAAAAAVLLAQLAGSRNATAVTPSTPGFLTEALGAPQSTARLVREPAPGVRLAAEPDGFRFERAGERVAISADTGGRDWHAFEGGATRSTPFGTETVLFRDEEGIEQFLTVERRQGPRTWRWRLDAAALEPVLKEDGSVAFLDGERTGGLELAPVEILDADGGDVTPEGLRWSLAEDVDGRWLELDLDDRGLPLPYVIDPNIVQSGSNQSSTQNGTTLAITRPGSVGDLLVAQIATRTTGAITAPTGWNIVGTAQVQGATIQQAVYWRFATGTDDTTWTFGSGHHAGVIVAYANAHPISSLVTTPVHQSSVNSNSTAPATATGVTTTLADTMLVAAYSVANDGTLTQDAAQGLTLVNEAAVTGGGPAGNRLRAILSDGAQASAAATGDKTATMGTTANWIAHLLAIRKAPDDGDGTLTTGTTGVAASSTGNTIQFTYTAGAQGTAAGAVTVAVPTGWTAPSLTATNAGYTTASAGTVSVSGQTITVSGLDLAPGGTVTITYGSTAGGGPGATASGTTGAQTWQAQQRGTAAGTLTNLGSSPSITVYAADGSGTLTTPTTNVAADSTGNTVVLTYTADAGGMSDGAVTVEAPAGWPAPGAGNTSASTGSLSFSGQTVTVVGVTLAGGATLTVTYGTGGGVTAPSATGAQTWQARQRSLSGGTLTDLAASPSITVNAADGSGTLTSDTASVGSSTAGNTLVFTYTAAAGGMAGGAVTVAVPSGWSAPSTTGTDAGYTTASTGSVSVAGQTITVSGVTLAGAGTLTIAYGSTAGGGPGATAPGTAGDQTWQAQQRSVSGSTLTDLASSPTVTVLSQDGAGTLSVGTPEVGFSSPANTLAFTYTAAAGGMAGGDVTLAVPGGWPAPSTTGTDAGYTTASTGSVSVAGQTITVSGVTLAGAGTLTITYGSSAGGGPGATASASAGSETWQAQQRGTSSGTLTDLAESPSVEVMPAPTAAYSFPASGGAYNAAGWDAGCAAPGFCGTETDSSGSGMDTVEVSIRRGSGNYWNGTSFGSAGEVFLDATLSGGTWSLAFGEGSFPADDEYTVRIRPRDNLGGLGAYSSRTFTIDRTPPAGLTITTPSGPTTDTTPTFSGEAGTAPGDAATVTVEVFDSDSGLVQMRVASVSGGTWSVDADPALADGEYTATATQADAAGNSTTTAPSAFAVDTVKPASSADALAAYQTSPTFPITYSASDATSGVDEVELWVRRPGDGSYSLADTDTDPGTPSFSYTADAGDGTYLFYTRARDNAGNYQDAPGSEDTSTLLDTTPPGAPSLVFGSFTNASATGTTVFFRPGVAGGFTLTPSSTDAESGVDFYTFPALGSGWARSGGDYTFTDSAAEPGAGNQVTATNNAGLESDPTAFTATADSTAPTTTAECDGGGCGGWFTATPVSVTLSASDGAGSGVAQVKYTLDGSDPTAVNGVVYAAPIELSATTTVKFRAWDAVGNAEPVATLVVQVDTTAPAAPSLSFGSFTAAVEDAGTVWYRPGAAEGSFTVTASASDPESGIASYGFPAAASGWAVSGSGNGRSYSHSGSPSDPAGAQQVTATNNAGLTSPAAEYQVEPDSTPPTVTAPTVSAGYHTALSVPVTLNGGSDAQSGVDAGSSVLERDEAPLTGGSCDSFPGSWTTVTLSGGNDTGVESGKCYRYRELLSDRVGNQGVSAASATVMVDTTAPSAPTLGFGSVTNASATGTTVFFRPGVAGGFTLTPSSTDAESGVDFYSYPALGSGWAGSGGAYTFTDSAAEPGTGNEVTATNKAGLESGPTTFTVTADSTAPASAIACDGGACSAGWYTSTPVSVTLSADDGAGSGVSQIKYSLDGSDPIADGLVYSVPLDLTETATVRYAAIDNVGNAEAVNEQEIRIDTTPPGAPSLVFGSFTNASATGTTVFFRPGVAGGFTLTPSSTDAESGVDFYTFPALGSGWAGSGGDYTFTDSAAEPGAGNQVTATNNAGLESDPTVFTVTADSTAPASSIACEGGSCAGWFTATPVSVTLSASDAQSGVELIRYTTDGSDPTLGNGTTYAGAFTVSETTTVKFRAWDRVGNAEAVQTQLVQVDTTAPVVSAGAGAATGSVYTSGSGTVWYRPGGSGSFELTATVTDPDSGAQQADFPAIAGFGDASTDTTPPYAAPYSYTGTPTEPGTVTVTGTNNAGLSAGDTITVAADSTPPAVSAPTVSSSYHTTLSVPVTLNGATDAGSGVAPGSSIVERDEATLSGGVCGEFGDDWTVVTLTDGADETVASDRCYRYRELASDRVGNQGVSAPSATAMVDATPPTGSVTAPAAGADVRGTIAVEAEAADSGSGVASVAFQRAPAGTGTWTTIDTDTASPYSASFDTTAVADGLYDLRTITTDEAGNTTASALVANVRVDNTPPSSAILDPLPGAIRNGQPLTGSGTDDGSGVASIEYLYCEGASCTPGTPIGSSSTGPGYAVAWSAQPADGTHQVLARVSDAAGNTLDSDKQTVTIDNTAPTGSVTAPAEAANVRGASVTVSSDSADGGSGVASVRFDVRESPAGSWTEIGTDATAPYSVSWNTTGLDDGLYDLRAVTTDAAGNTFTSPAITVRVDNTPPAATLSFPADEGAYNAAGWNAGCATPGVCGTANDGGSGVDYVEISIREGSGDYWSGSAFDSPIEVWVAATGTAAWSYAFDSAQFPVDGPYTVRFRAADEAGNVGAAGSATFEADTVAPETTIDSQPDDPTSSTSAAFSFSSNEADVTFECELDGGGFEACASPRSYEDLAPGSHTFRVRATDEAGNADLTPAEFSWLIDTTPPTAPSLSFGSFTAASATGTTVWYRPDAAAGAFTVSASSTDAESGIASYSFPAAADGWTVSGAGASRSYEHAGSPTDPAEPLQVTATNNAGLSSDPASYSVTPDGDAPTGVSVTVAGGYVTALSVPVTLDLGTDAGSGVDPASAVLERDEAALADDACGAFPASWSAVTLTGGNDTTVESGTCYRYRYRVSDRVGNEAISAVSATVHVDTTKPSTPTLSFGSFTNASVTGSTVYFRPGVAGGFTVTPSSTDPESGIASYSYPALGSGWSSTGGDYSFTGSAADPAEPSEITATNNAGLTSDPAAFTVSADGTAPATSAGCDGGGCGGWFTSSPVSVALSASDGAGSGVAEIRYTLDGSDPTPVNGTAYAAPFDLTATTTVKFRAWDNVGNAEAVVTLTVQIDTTAPSAPALTLSESSPHSHAAGTTLYYNPSAGLSGSFTVAAATSDGESGIAKVAFPALDGMTGGGDDTAAPYEAVYGWDDASTASGSQTVTAENGAGLTAGSSFTVTPDTAAPTGMSATVAGGYVTVLSVPVTLDDGTDAGSGVAAGSGVLERDEAALAGDDCGAFPGSWSAVTLTGGDDTTVESGKCYRYRYSVSDNVGNVGVSGASATVKVDTTAPSAPTLSFGSFTNASATGTAVYFRPGVGGGFTLSASSTDPESGVSSYSYPALGSGWSSTGGEYSFTDSAADPAEPLEVTATNNAGLTSAASEFTVTADSTDPVTTIACDGGACGGWFGTSPVTVTLSASDSGSGVAEVRYTTDGSDPATGTLYAGPFEVSSTATVRFRALDAVGNAEEAQSRLVQIDTTAPSVPSLSFSGLTSASVTGSTVYYRPGVAGGFTLTAEATDAESGIASYAFPSLGEGWSASGSGDARDYSWTGTPEEPGPGRQVTATNNAGLTGDPAGFAVAADSTAPVTTISCDGEPCSDDWHTATPVAVGLSASDGGSGVAEIRYTLDGSDPTPVNGAVYAAPFDVPATTTVRYRAFDNVGNAEPIATQEIRIDTTPPGTPALTLEAPGPWSHLDGTTLYYNPGAGNSGSFTVTADTADADSGIARVAFPTLDGTTGGGDDTTPPYQATYSWDDQTAAAGSHTVTAHDNAGLTSTAAFTTTPDTTAPASSIECDGAACSAGWYTTSPVPVTLSAGDGGSGVAEIRYTTDGSDPLVEGTPYAGAFDVAETATVRYAAIDNVGNAEAVNEQEIRIDATPPSAPSLSFGSFTNASATGTTVFFRPGAAGGFTVTPSSTDPESGVASYGYPALGSGWSNTDGVYAFTDTAAEPGAGNDVTATNGAGLTSAATSFTVTADADAPVTAIACDGGACGGWHGASPVSVSLAAGDGAGSGVDQIRYTTDGTDPTLGNGTTYAGAFTVAATTTVKFRAWDRVGNAEAVQSQTVQIDTTPPTAPSLSFGSFTNASATGTTVFFRPGAAGGFTLTPSSTDPESGIDFYTFPALGSGWSNTGGDYSFTDAAAEPGAGHEVTATNNAALESDPAAFTVAADGDAPLTTIACDGGSCAPWHTTSPVSVTLAADDGAGSGVDLIRYTTDGSDPTLANGTTYAGAFTVAATTTVKYRAWDRVGNAEPVDEQEIRIDTTPPSAPTLSFGSFTNASAAGTTVWYRPGAAGGFTLTPSSTDAESGIAFFGFPALGSGWSRTGGDYTFTGAAAEPGAGHEVTATNGAGLSSDPTAFAVLADAAAPVTTIACDGGACDGWHTASPVTVGLGATDAGSGVAEIRYTLDGSDPTPVSGTVYGGAFTVAATATVKYRAWDNVGNAEPVATQLVQIDVTPPDVTLGDPGANLRGTVELTATATDADSGVAGVAFQRSPAGEDTWTTIATDTDGGDGWSADLDTTAVADGLYDLRAVATDAAGLTAVHAVASRRVDNTPPAVALADPGTPLRATVALSAAADDAGGSGVVSVAFQRSPAGDDTWTTVSTDTDGGDGWTAELDTTAVADGLYDLRAVATDAAGNTGTSTVAAREVDNTPPGTSFTATPPDPSDDDSPSFSFGSSEAGSTFECRLDGDAWEACTSPHALSGLSETTHTFEVRATDAAGNVDPTPASHTWLVDTTPPTAVMDDPGANLSGTVTLTSTTSDAGSGVATVTYQVSPAGEDDWTDVPAEWDTTSAGDGLYDLRVVAVDNAGNGTASAPVTDRRVDNGPPVISITAPSGWVNAADPDPFPIVVSSADTDIAQVEFFECSEADCDGGTETSLGVDDDGEPWTITAPVPADGPWTIKAVATDLASNLGTAVVNVTVDRTPPAGGSVSYAGGWNTSGSVAVTTVDGTDSGSGLDLDSRLLERDSATLTEGACGPWADTWTAVPAPDTTVAGGLCYRYRFTIADNAGNAGTYTSASVVSVDLTPPTAPSLAFGSFTNASATGSTVYYRPDAAGGFTLTPTSSDPESGVSSYSYPNLGTGWSRDGGAYSFTAGAANPGPAKNITAENAAGLISSATQLTVTPDGLPPVSSALCDGDECSAGWYTAAPVSVTLSATDDLSGVAVIRYTTDGSEPSLLNGSSYSGAIEVATVGGTTIRYRAYDAVGNEEAVATLLVRIDTTPPSAPALGFSGFANASATGSTVYFRPGAAGGFTVSASSTDDESGIASYEFPALGSGWSSTDGAYAFDASAAEPAGAQEVTAVNGAGLTASSSFSVVADGTAPVSSIACDGAACSAGWYTTSPVTVSLSASDAGSGVKEIRYTTDGSDPAAGAVYSGALSLAATTTVKYVAIDEVGNVEGERTYELRIDTTPPAATMHDPGQYASGTVELSSTASDADSGVDTVVYEVSEAGAGTWTSVPASWDTTAAADGAYDLRVVVTDVAGNSTASAPVEGVVVDNLPPTVTMNAPASPASGVVTLSATAIDAHSGIDTVVFEYSVAGGNDWQPTSSSWNTAALDDGGYDLRAIATDRAGNQAVSDPVDGIQVDNDPPEVALTAPAAGSYLNSSSPDPATLTATASDDGTGVATVEFFQCSNASADCESGSWSSIDVVAAPGPYAASWPLPADGARALRAVATDGAGHSAGSVVNVVVDRTPPTASIDDPGEFLRLTIELTATASDATSGVNTVTFQYSAAGAGDWQTISTDTTAPYAATLDTTALADGLYDFRVFVTDVAGNASTATVANRLIDNTPPTAAITDPGQYLRETAALTASADDPGGSGVASVAFRRSPAGADTWTTIGTDSDGGGGWSVPFDTTLVADGLYDLQVLVTDRAGNTSADTVASRLVDNTKPTASLTDPGPYLRLTVALEGAASDDGSGVAAVAFQRSAAGSGGPWTTIATDTDGDDGWSVSFDTTLVADGLYDLRVLVSDRAGNEETFVVAGRRVDNTPPTAAIADPGANLRSAVTLTASADDTGSGVESVRFEHSPAGAGSWTEIGTDTDGADGWSAAFDTTAVADGLYDLRAVVTDRAGNAADSVVASRRVDNTAPVTTHDAPSSPSSIPVTVTLSATDAGSGWSETQYRLNGGAWQSGNVVAIPAPADHSNDGSHLIEFYSTDVAGNVEAVRSATVVIDTVGAIGAPADPGAFLRGLVTLEAEAEDDSGVVSVEFQFAPAGSGAWATIDTDLTPPYSVIWNTTAVTDGEYDLQVVVTDGAGNVSETPLPGLPKIVDNTPPTGSVTAPAEGAFVSGTTAVSASASDTPVPSAIATVEFQVRPAGAGGFTTIAVDASAPFTAAWDTTAAPDGPAELRVVVTDLAGNVSAPSAVRTVNVDNDPPDVELASPGAATNADVALTATGSADIVQVVFQRSPAGAGTWTTIGTDTTPGDGFTALFAVGGLGDGSYDLRAIATDGSGNTGTSSVRTIVVDRVAPTGSVTAPSAGATIGGPNAALAASAADAGSGVATVTFRYRVAGSSDPYADIATVSGSPWSVTWDATAVPTGSYELRVRVVDAAGNAFESAAVTVTVDSTAPTVSLADPGASVYGTVTLTASVSGAGATHVVFERSPAGADAWAAVGTATGSPYSVSFDTASVADGLYDLRATVFDGFGNSNTSVRSGIRIDNTPPSVVAAVPADGTVVPAASSIELTVSEPLHPTDPVPGLTHDGSPAAASVSGTTVTVATGALAPGPHTLAGTLRDEAGRTAPFRVHFTVMNGTPAEVPYVEKNSSLSAPTSLPAADGSSLVVMPPHAWTDPGTGDWLVLRVKPVPAAAFGSGGSLVPAAVVDVTARWALAGAQHDQFNAPLEIRLPWSGRGVLPATLEGGAWRYLARLPQAGVLPPGWGDGWYSDGSGIRILTRHLSVFGLIQDLEPPEPPRGGGIVAQDGLTLRWEHGRENSGLTHAVDLFVNGVFFKRYGATEFEAKLGPFEADDTRTFTLVQVDAADNSSAPSAPIRAIPQVVGMTLAQAEGTLAGRGFALGRVREAASEAPAGTVIEPTGIILWPEGSAVDVTVSAGAEAQPAPEARLTFQVVGTKTFDWRERKFVALHVTTTRPSNLTSSLMSPQGTRLYTWRSNVRAGASVVRLPMPTQVRRPGAYRVVVTAASGGQTTRSSVPVRIVGPGIPRTITPQKRSVEVVLTGRPEIRNQIALGLRGTGTRVLQGQEDTTFSLTGSPGRNVQVVVVDVDRFGAALVRDLKIVFPSVKVIALASGVQRQTAAKSAGATVTLPRSAPPARITRTIRALTQAR